MLVDTHCHINFIVKSDFSSKMNQKNFEDASIVVEEAKKNRVTKIINIGTNFIESQNCVEIAKQNPGCFAAIGIHPNDGEENWQDGIAALRATAENKTENRVVAIGECGIDLHYPGYNLERQVEMFKAHIELALEFDLPLVIHMRDAKGVVSEVLNKFKDRNIRGVVHCYSEGIEFAKYAIDLGLMIGFVGSVTYPKNETLREVAKWIPIDKMLLETDAPWLAPQAYRGKKNAPMHVLAIARFIAELRGMSLEDLAKQTTSNADRLFGLDKF